MYDGGLSIETYLAGAGRDVASIVDNEQLKCTASLTIYIYIKPRKVPSHGRIFPCFCYLSFYEKKFKFLGFNVVVIVKAFPLIHQLSM